MSCDIFFRNDCIEVEFNRTITKQFAHWLRDPENKVVRLGITSVGIFLGHIEATVVPDPTGKKQVSAMYSYKFDLEHADTFRALDKGVTIIASNMIRGEMVAYGVCKATVKSTRYEVFTPPPVFPTHRASADWDHMKSIEDVLFNRESVFINFNFKAHWSDATEGKLSLLIPKDEENGDGDIRHYTELTLGEDGWRYSSDLISDTVYTEIPVEMGMHIVQQGIYTQMLQP